MLIFISNVWFLLHHSIKVRNFEIDQKNRKTARNNIIACFWLSLKMFFPINCMIHHKQIHYIEKKLTDTKIATASQIQSQQIVKSVCNGHFGGHKNFSTKR